VVTRITRDAVVAAFGVTSIVVVDRAASMMILVGGVAMGAAMALNMNFTSAQVISTSLLDARLIGANARMTSVEDARVIVTTDARVVNATDAGVMVTTDARVVNTTDARVITDAKVSPLF